MRRRWAAVRLRLLVTVVVAALAGAGASAATAAFTDTANSPFRTEIDHIEQAGCATGFPDGSFRPKHAVNRQQFAAWMNRCGGRVEHDGTGDQVLSGDPETTLAQAAMTSGAAAESAGGGFLVAIAGVEARDADAAGDVVFRLHVEGGGTETVVLTSAAETAVAGSMTEVVPVPAGATTDVELTAERAPGVPVTVDATLTLLYVPFAGDGTGGGAA